MDKNDLYELLGLCAIFFPFFSFCLRIYAQIIKKFNAYVFSFFFRLSDQSELHFMYILLFNLASIDINNLPASILLAE